MLSVDLGLLYISSLLSVPFIYYIICLSVFYCSYVGLDVYYPHLFTVCIMSDLI